MPTADLTSLDDWIAREAISFSLDSADSLNAAVDRLIATAGPSLDILALGEPTHLVNDYLRLRNCVFQSLVERHGFSAIAIESSFTRGVLVQHYIGSRYETLTIDDSLAQGITHQMGMMPAQRELLEWMRQYNAAEGDSKKLRFYGFDSPTEMTHADSPRELLAVALNGLGMVRSPNHPAMREKILPLIGDDAAWENPAAITDPSKSIGRSPAANELRLATEYLIAELASLRPLGMTENPAAYRQAMRHAILARQMLTYHAGLAQESPTRFADLLAQRDSMMADNLAYIAEQEKERGRVFVFAHNTHLKRGQAVWEWGPTKLAWWPAGAHLSVTMESRYKVIGVAAGRSAASNLGAPEPGTLEAHLLAALGPARIIPTHLGKLLGARDLPTRSANPQYFPFDPQSRTDFDFLAVLDEAN